MVHLCWIPWLILIRGARRQVVPRLGLQLPQVSFSTCPYISSAYRLHALGMTTARVSLRQPPHCLDALSSHAVPFDGIVKALGENVEITYAEGARGAYNYVTVRYTLSILI